MHRNDRQLIAGLSGHTVRVTGHHHPLEVNGLGPLAVRLLGDHDVSIEVDPAVHHLQGLLAHGLAVDIEHNLVPEHSKVEFVPVVVKNLSLLPRQRLELPVVVEDGELDGVPPGVEAHGELGLAPGVGDPDELPPVLSWPPIAESGHKAELLGQTLVEDLQCGHDEVSRGVDPVGGLHPVGAPDPGHAWVAVQVHVKLELPDEVK